MHAHPVERSRPHCRGMTLVEIIAILILIGAMSAVVVSQFPDMAEKELFTRVEVVKDHIRYAQLMSMKQDNIFGVSCDGDDYWLFRSAEPVDPGVVPTAAANRIALPGETGDIVNLAADDMALTAFTVFFDHTGEPYSSYVDDDPDNASNVALAGDLNLTLSHSDYGSTLDVTITAFTGFVP